MVHPVNLGKYIKIIFLFWEGETKGINKQYEGCQSLYHFIETFYNDILSFQYNRDKTIQDGEMLLVVIIVLNQDQSLLNGQLLKILRNIQM